MFTENICSGKIYVQAEYMHRKNVCSEIEYIYSGTLVFFFQIP